MYTITDYPKEKAYHEMYHELLNFLLDLNEKNQFLYMHWSRFEWMFARDSFEEDDLSSIKIFRKGNDISGLILFEDDINHIFLIYKDDILLKQDMVNTLVKISGLKNVCISNDREMIHLLEQNGLKKASYTEPIAVFTLDNFEIPAMDGYTIISLQDDYNLDEIHHVLWKGFNHGDVTYSEENREMRRHMTSSPAFNRAYAFVAVKDHKYVSFANIWYKKDTKKALIEPVATVPEHRQKGLSKICIYHAIKAVLNDGAKEIYVGSDQIFYQKIGFKTLEPGLWYTMDS